MHAHRQKSSRAVVVHSSTLDRVALSLALCVRHITTLSDADITHEFCTEEHNNRHRNQRAVLRILGKRKIQEGKRPVGDLKP